MIPVSWDRGQHNFQKPNTSVWTKVSTDLNKGEINDTVTYNLSHRDKQVASRAASWQKPTQRDEMVTVGNAVTSRFWDRGIKPHPALHVSSVH